MFVRNIAIFSIVDFVGIGIGALTAPISTRLLSIDQYGALPLLMAVWSIFTIVQFVGMDSAFVMYRARGDHDTRSLIATSTIVATCAAIVVWTLFGVVGLTTPWLSGYASVSKIEMAAFLCSVLPSTLIAWHLQLLRYMNEALRFAKVTLVGRIASGIVALPVMYVLPQGQRLAGCLFTYALFGFLSYVLAVREVRLSGFDPHARQFYSAPLVGPMITLGTALIPGALVYSLNAVTDRLLLGWFSNTAEVAVFTLAGAVAGVALVFKAAFSRTWEPYVVNRIAMHDERLYLPQLQTAADFIGPLIVVATCLSLAWANTIFLTIFPTDYMGGGKLLPILVLAGTLGTLTIVANLTELISGLARYRLPIYAAGFLVNFSVCVMFIPQYGAYGAALGVLAGETAILLLWIILGRWLLGNLRLNWTISLCCVALSVVLSQVYRPGQFLQDWVVGEQLVVTAICAAVLWILGRRALKRLESLQVSDDLGAIAAG